MGVPYPFKPPKVLRAVTSVTTNTPGALNIAPTTGDVVINAIGAADLAHSGQWQSVVIEQDAPGSLDWMFRWTVNWDPAGMLAAGNGSTELRFPIAGTYLVSIDATLLLTNSAAGPDFIAIGLESLTDFDVLLTQYTAAVVLNTPPTALVAWPCALSTAQAQPFAAADPLIIGPIFHALGGTIDVYNRVVGPPDTATVLAQLTVLCFG